MYILKSLIHKEIMVVFARASRLTNEMKTAMVSLV